MIYTFPITQNNHLNDWYRYDGFLSNEDIEYLIKSHEQVDPWKGGVVSGMDQTSGETTSEVHDDIRNVSIKTINLNETNLWLFDRVSALVQDANQYYNFNLTGLTEHMQLLHYGEDISGGHYDWHTDTGYGAISTRKLTIIIQLTDPSNYEGCDVELFKRGTLDKTPGTAMIFPSNMHHRVTELTSGFRDCVVCWVNGPPFR